MPTKKKSATAKERPKAGTSRDGAAHRRKLFVEAYIANGGNASEAARTAGFSAKTSGQAGYDLLKEPQVATEIEARQKKIAAKFELRAEDVLRNLAQAIYFDPRKLYREDGSLKAVTELDDDTAMALAGFEVTEEKETVNGHRQVVGFTKKVKWLDKNAAREQAMKHLGQYREDNNQRNPLANVPRDTLKTIVERLSAK